MNVDISVHDTGLSMQLERAVPIAVFAVSEEALKDCNYFCKEDTETLIKSSLVHSVADGKTCELKWCTPYAAKQYHFPPTRLDKNPNACPEWCDKAYSTYHDRWKTVFLNGLRQGGL